MLGSPLPILSTGKAYYYTWKANFVYCEYLGLHPHKFSTASILTFLQNDRIVAWQSALPRAKCQAWLLFQQPLAPISLIQSFMQGFTWIVPLLEPLCNLGT